VVSFTPRPFYRRGKSSRYPLDRRLDGLQTPSGRHGEVKILATTGTGTGLPARSAVGTCANCKCAQLQLSVNVFLLFTIYETRENTLIKKLHVVLKSALLFHFITLTVVHWNLHQVILNASKVLCWL
jgi:hypothetical protein